MKRGKKKERGIVKMRKEKRLYFYLHVIKYNLEEITMTSSMTKNPMFVEQNITFCLNL